MDYITTDIVALAVSFVCAAIVITLFMLATAIAANSLGDSTPKQNGRITLNPLKQIEIVGYILFVFFGYGWGKPVETRAGNFKDRKKGVIITYSAPIVLGILLAEVIYGVGNTIAPAEIAVYTNTLAATFIKFSVINIIPIYPLNGSYVIKACLEPNKAMAYAQKERGIGQIVFLFLVLLGFLSTPLNFIVNLLLGW